ncbi:MAG TPA: glycosyltransferase family 2 protein [Chthoniobacteraceae bacterium]|nr:glycosyltransferase family 2 protein [Chthoniobacteraceae bacterium]
MNPNLPRVTVVTPSFNQAQFLETTILSVLGQCYPKLEYIVMDGGSTDGSAEIIRRYGAQIAYWQSQPDGGQAAAINAGFSRATGDILCWLNSDDFFLPGTLLRIAHQLAARVNEPALTYGSCLFFREGPSASAKILKARSFDAAQLRATDYIVQPSAFWTRSLWEKTGPLDETLTFGFDWDWFIRASTHADFVPVEEILSAYRRHAAHKSGSGGTRRREEITKVVHRHGDARLVEAYDFTLRHWSDVQRWSAIRRWMEKRGVPGAGAIPRATVPALWRLPQDVTLHDVRIAAGMLADA